MVQMYLWINCNVISQKHKLKWDYFFKTYFLGSKLGIKLTFNLVYDSVSFYKLDSKKKKHPYGTHVCLRVKNEKPVGTRNILRKCFIFLLAFFLLCK